MDEALEHHVVARSPVAQILVDRPVGGAASIQPLIDIRGPELGTATEIRRWLAGSRDSGEGAIGLIPECQDSRHLQLARSPQIARVGKGAAGIDHTDDGLRARTCRTHWKTVSRLSCPTRHWIRRQSAKRGHANCRSQRLHRKLQRPALDDAGAGTDAKQGVLTLVEPCRGEAGRVRIRLRHRDAALAQIGNDIRFDQFEQHRILRRQIVASTVAAVEIAVPASRGEFGVRIVPMITRQGLLVDLRAAHSNLNSSFCSSSIEASHRFMSGEVGGSGSATPRSSGSR